MGSLYNVIQQLVQNIDPALDKVIVQDSRPLLTDSITYICVAEPGTDQSEVGWRIWRIMTVNPNPPTKDVIGTPFNVDTGKFSALGEFICSQRENYTYSQGS